MPEKAKKNIIALDQWAHYQSLVSKAYNELIKEKKLIDGLTDNHLAVLAQEGRKSQRSESDGVFY